MWNKALDKYREELKDGDDFEESLYVNSMEELLGQVKAMDIHNARIAKTLSSLNRLEPMLTHLNDFSAVIALFLGADTKGAALVWGSLRIILSVRALPESQQYQSLLTMTKLALPAGSDILGDILDMLEELTLSLPKFKAYERNLPLTPPLESALLSAYTEMLCFCARTINFFRNNPHGMSVTDWPSPALMMVALLRRTSWAKMDGDFRQTIKRLRSFSQVVDIEAETVRLQVDRERNAEILAVMQSLKQQKVANDILPCFSVPAGIQDRFFGRDDILKEVRDALNPSKDQSGLQTAALYGMGGSGKTQIALRYAHLSRNCFDAILWISADNSIKMAQVFLDIAQRLGLISNGDEIQDSAAAMMSVKIWLSTTGTLNVSAAGLEMTLRLN